MSNYYTCAWTLLKGWNTWQGRSLSIETLQLETACEYNNQKRWLRDSLSIFSVDHSLNVYVADFGLSRDVYSRDYYRMGIKAAKLPIKWMSPESLNDGLYGEKSDVVSSKIFILSFVSEF